MALTMKNAQGRASGTIQNFRIRLTQEFNTHPNYDIAVRVLNCLLHIKDNLDDIAETINDPKASRTLRDKDGMAFHIAFAKNSGDVITTFTSLIQQVEHCIQHLNSHDDPIFISIFISHIRNSQAGCMEARLRQALDFCVFSLSRDNHWDLHDLFQALNNTSHIQKLTSELEICQRAFEFFEQRVHYKTPVVINGELQPLHWRHIKEYLCDFLYVDINCWNNLKSIDTLIPVKDHSSYLLYFSTEKDANSWLAFIRSVLSDTFQTELDAARVISERDNGYRFRLLKHQFEAFSLACDNANQPSNESMPTTVVVDEDDRLKGAYLVKSIRWDKLAFLDAFLRGTTRSNGQQDPISLRKGTKERFVVYPEGVYERPDKPDRFTPTEEDKHFSPYQSTSLVTDKVRSPIFGHMKARKKYLVGIVIPLNHAKLGSGMVYDSGTVNRPFDFDTREEAEAYWQQKTNSANPTLFANLAELETTLEQEKYKHHHNEVLAKLRFAADGSCQIGIFSDTLEARLIAQWYARKMRDHLRAKAKEDVTKWDATYRVPLCFYLPEQQIYFDSYTPDEQAEDVARAMKLLQSSEFIEGIKKNNDEGLYECLLAPLLVGEYDKNIYKEVIDGAPLLIKLLDAGKYQLLEALLEQDFEKVSREIQWKPAYQNYLFEAVKKGHCHLIRWLCDIGSAASTGFDWMACDSEEYNLLMMAALYQPTAIAPLLNFITQHADSLGEECIRQFILQVTKDDWNALMLAALCQPTAIAPLLNFITQHACPFGKAA